MSQGIGPEWVAPPPPPAKPPRSRLAVIALVVAVVALGLSGAVAWVTFAPVSTAAGCEAKSLWTKYPAGNVLPSGWRWTRIDISEQGISGSIEDATAGSEFLNPSLYFTATCSSDPATFLATAKALADGLDEGTAIGFPTLGDELFAQRMNDGCYEVVWRTGSILAEVSCFSEDIDIGAVEDFATAVQAAIAPTQ